MGCPVWAGLSKPSARTGYLTCNCPASGKYSRVDIRSGLNLFVQAIRRGFRGMAPRFSKEDSRAIWRGKVGKTRNGPRWANKILNPVPANPAFSGLQEILNSF